MRAETLPGFLASLLKQAGLRADDLDPARTWAVYKRALLEPVTDAGRKMTSRVSSAVTDGTIAPCVYFTRQFSIWSEEAQKYVLAAGSLDDGILGFAFGFQYPRQYDAMLSDFMYWSSDFGSTEEFVEAVEGEARFQLALTLKPLGTGLSVDSPLSEH